LAESDQNHNRPSDDPVPSNASTGPTPPNKSAIELIDFSQPGPERHLSVRAVAGINRIFCHTLHRLRILAPCPVPASGPAILVCNHTSGLDPPLLQATCPRIIIWMMAREYYENPLLNWLYRRLQIIPVDRAGHDSTVLRQGLRALEHGRLLGIFPEGRIEEDDRLLPFQEGVAVMAAKAPCDVYPAFLDGTQRGHEILRACLRPQQAVVNFGPPLSFVPSSPKESRQAGTARITQAVEQLRQATLLRRVTPHRATI
jgi:1-acyl-sn-glycerol-3-phosphate acyltransferase